MTVLYLNEIKGDSYEVVITRSTPKVRTQTGYGAKLPTRYMVVDHNDNGRKRRVYAICYSNAASLYVTIDGVQYFLRDQDIPERPRQIGLPDKRYTISREWTGKATPQFVARFCGDWISSHGTYEEAETAAGQYEERRSNHGAR